MLFQKAYRLCRLKSADRHEIWQEWLARKCESIESQISDMMSYFQDGGHDVISRMQQRPPAAS